MTMSPATTNRLVAEYLAIEAEDAKEAGALAYMARSLVMATLPHSKPDGLVFQRQNGNYTLTMMANPQFGLPYGSLPRLLLAWITREAKLNKSPVIYLGKTFSSFLRTLKLSQSGGKRGDATNLRKQMLRLFTTHISCVYQDKKEGTCQGENFSVAQSFNLWWDPVTVTEDDSDFLPNSTITLNDAFYQELIDRPIPVDFRVLRAFRRSPLQIDIYVWLTYRLPFLKRATFISWGVLKNQFGSDYADDAQGLRDFKKQFLKALHTVQVFYHQAQIEIKGDGIMLSSSPPHIKQTSGDWSSLYAA
jgi:hypothetical protein